MRSELEQLIPLVDGVALTFNEICEVVLHDLANPSSSLVYIRGNLTGRKIGAPATNLVLSVLKSEGNQSKDIIGYISKTSDGKILKSSTVFIRDNSGKIIGCFCINIDITHITLLNNVLNSLCKPSFPREGDAQADERFTNDISEMTELIIQEAVNELGKPVELMDKDEKIKIVKILENKGLFLVKGAVSRVAKALQVSKFTVYNYLEDVRISNNDEERN